MAIKFNPFTGNFDFTNDDPLTLSGLTVTGLSTLNHIHGDLAGSVYIHVKNTSGVQLAKGTPVYVTGAVGDTITLEVAAADSSNPAKMPAIGILADTLAVNGFGHAAVAGELTALNTAAFEIGDPLFVASGGGLTRTRPTTGVIQQVAIVGRDQTNTGSVTVTISTELELFTSTTSGLVPGSGGGSVNFLRADGTWAAPPSAIATPPGGSTTQVQFNDAGVFGGDPDFTWDKTANKLNVKGDVVLDDGGTFEIIVQAVPPTATRYITYPDASGTIALTSALRGKSFFDATDGKPPATNFARRDTRNSVPVLEFRDSPADESTFFIGVIPPGTDMSSGLQVRLWWMADTATSGNVRWVAEFERIGTDLDSDSFDTATEVTAVTNSTSGVPEIAQMICTSVDSLMAGDAYRLRVTRKASDTTNDTMTGDAQIVAVEVRGVA